LQLYNYVTDIYEFLYGFSLKACVV